MTCSTVETQLDAYLSGRLSELDATRLETHAAHCDRCGPLLEVRGRLDVALPLEVAPAPPYRANVMTHVRFGRRTHGFRWWMPAAVAAGLLLAVGLLRPPVKNGQRPVASSLPAAIAAQSADGEFQHLDAARAELRAAIADSPGDPALMRALERLDAQRKSMENLIREFET